MHGLDSEKLESFLVKSNHNCSYSVFGDMEIDNKEDISQIVEEFKQHEAEMLWKGSEEYKAALDKATAEKIEALTNILITSGFNFDGYTIIKYSGYISGDDAISVDRGSAIFGFGKDVKDELLGSLVIIRRNALAELKEAAYALGCNAVIGVDFDYFILDPQTANLTGGTTYMPYIFGVTANGNAVVIEKNG